MSNTGPNKSPATDPVAIEVAHLVKLYKATRRSTACPFRSSRTHHWSARLGNGAGKNHDHAMIMGMVLPTSGRIAVLGHPMPTRAHEVLAGMNFERPLCRYADAADGAAETSPSSAGSCGAASEERIEQLASDLDLEIPRPCQRQNFGPAEDARRAGQR